MNLQELYQIAKESSYYDEFQSKITEIILKIPPPIKSDIFTDTLILTPYINQQKNINPVKARFDNILKESFFNDLSQLSKITRYEFKTYRKVGNAVLDYTETLLKQNNITFKQSTSNH